MRWRLSTLGLVFLAIGISQLWVARDEFRKDYYWTAATRHEPLANGANKFEVYVRDQLLNRAAESGVLGTRSGDAWTPLQPTDISIRLNHIDEVTRTPLLIGVGFSSAGLAWILALLIPTRRTQQPEL
jgi:hypothetical protein